jgi:hypothetical protein
LSAAGGHSGSPRPEPAPAAFLESRQGRRSTARHTIFQARTERFILGVLGPSAIGDLDLRKPSHRPVNILSNARPEVLSGLRMPPALRPFCLGAGLARVLVPIGRHMTAARMIRTHGRPFLGTLGVWGRVHLSNSAESKRNRALLPSIWAVSREVSKPVISGVSPS